MAKKPNYRFERQERERLKAEKKAAREAERVQRKIEEEGGTGEPGDAGASTGEAAATAGETGAAAPGAAAQPQYSGPPIAIRPIETMTPAELETLHQNALRLAASGSARQKAAAQDLLPRLEAALEKIAEAKRQAAAAKMAQALRRTKSE